MIRWLGRGFLVLAVILSIALAGAFGYRAYRQAENARLLELDVPSAIVEAGYVEIGGLPQWIQIRGEDRGNPVLLVVHGGPGFSIINASYAAMRAWERHFTIAHWDQRGAGRTLVKNGASGGAPIATYVNDGLEVAEYLRRRLGQDTIVLLGWSWGSVVGTEMVRARPDLFSAYVGTGQVVNMQRNEEVGYQRLMERLRAAGATDSIEALEAIGPPPYDGMAELGAERQILLDHPPPLERGFFLALLETMAFAPGYGVLETVTILRGGLVPDEDLVEELLTYDALSRGTTFATPMIYILGAEDIQTPAELVEPYVRAIDAPRKQIVQIPGVGHFAPIFASERFLEALLEHVRPLQVAR